MGGYRQSWERVPEGPKPERRPVYTPTTEGIRENFAWADNYPYEGDVDPALLARFDLWLATVRADAWDEGYAAGRFDGIDQMARTPTSRGVNPYRGEARADSETPTGETTPM